MCDDEPGSVIGGNVIVFLASLDRENVFFLMLVDTGFKELGSLGFAVLDLPLWRLRSSLR